MGLEVLALGATLASSGVGAMGAMQSAGAASANAKYQAQVAQNNAITARQNAEASMMAGQHNAAREAAEGAERMGRIRAIQGASGIDVNSGSFRDVQDSQAIMTRIGEMNQAWRGEVQATNFRNQSNSYLAEAMLKQSEATYAQQAGGINAFTTLLGGASNAFKMHFQFNTGMYGSNF